MKKIYFLIDEIIHRVKKLENFCDYDFKGMVNGIVEMLNKLIEEIDGKEKRWKH